MIAATSSDIGALCVCIGIVVLLFCIEIYDSYFTKPDHSHSPGCKCPKYNDWPDDLEDEQSG